MSVAIHIGIAKTGSTWFQTRYFPRLPDYHFTHGDDVLRSLIRNLIREPEGRFAEDTLDAHASRLKGRAEPNVLISDEALGGYLFDGGAHRDRIVERLSRAFPDARILAFVREQRGMLRSLYLQYVANGGHRSFSDFCLADDVEGCASPLSFVTYDGLVEAYRTAFGAEQVKVLPYERFRAEPQAFLSEVCAFLGVAEHAVPVVDASETTNVALSPLSRELLRPINRWFRRSEFNTRPVVTNAGLAQVARPVLQATFDRRLFARSGRKLTSGDEALISELRPRFAQSNAVLQTMVDHRLGPYGYVLA